MCEVKHFLQVIISSPEWIAILLAPVVAVLIGEWLRNRNYKKQQKDGLLKNLIHFGYQLSPTYTGSKNEMLGALNEIKYWYHNDAEIKEKTFELMDLMGKGSESAQDAFVDLLLNISKKEGLNLSREDVERVFSMK